MRNRRQNPSIFLTSLIAVSIMTMLSAMPTGAYGDIFVTNNGGNTVGDYTTSGATVNASLITGLNGPTGIALSGSNLFVVNFNGNTVGEYTTSGATVNASLITGLSSPFGIAVTPRAYAPLFQGLRTTFSCVFEGLSRELSGHYIITTNYNTLYSPIHYRKVANM